MSIDSQLLIPLKFERWIVRDELSLRFKPDIPEEVFLDALRELLHAQKRVQFYLGDAINFASHRWKRGRYEQFFRESDYSRQRLYHFSWVSHHVPPERRRTELAYSLHEAVAPLPPEEQSRILDAAVQNRWNRAKIRECIKNLLPDKEPLQPQFGEALHFAGLHRAPINELGVVFLFGLISKRLGFDVEAVHSAFPDCSAKRLTDPQRNRWTQVSIEFEFRSSNFLLHKHPVSGCELIVCWEHDWLDCPIEVISLRDEVRKLQHSTHEA